MALRVIEWHCGIGGASAALGPGVEVIAAVDNHIDAISVYQQNFPDHKVYVKNIEKLTASQVARWGAADLWWMSPPCQPHTVLGKKLDMDDPRSASLARLLKLIEELRPPNLAMENVPGFAGSQSRELLVNVLNQSGYAISEEVVCPTQWGWPNRRQRFYLAASLLGEAGLVQPSQAKAEPFGTMDFIDPEQDRNSQLLVNESFMERYANAIQIVDRLENQVATNCFTSAYGRSPTRCGSYLWLPGRSGVRRFAPREILRYLDFPQSYQLPRHLSLKKLWSLAGNSLTLGSTRRVLSRLSVVNGQV